jgi:hypothetical protein
LNAGLGTDTALRRKAKKPGYRGNFLLLPTHRFARKFRLARVAAEDAAIEKVTEGAHAVEYDSTIFNGTLRGWKQEQGNHPENANALYEVGLCKR